MHSNSHPVEPEELMAYLDGELPVTQASAAAEHLSRCRECQAVAADLQSVSRRLVAWQVEVPEEGMRTELGAAIKGPQTKKAPGRSKGWLRRWPWAVGLAVACVVILLVLPRTLPLNQYAKFEALPQPQFYAQLAAPAKPVAAESEAVPPVVTNANGFDSGLIVHTAQLTLTTAEFAKTRDALEALLARYGGHLAQLSVNSPPGSGRTLQATLRVPSDHLPAAMADLRRLGRVEVESQGAEEVTQQVTDLEARLSNARITEQRLAEILRQRTGKISDVLEVEKEMGRVRGEIERMVAERKNLGDRVSFATVNVTITEEYRAGLQVASPSAFVQLRNAAVDGYRNLSGSLFGVAQFLLSAGPTLIVWVALLFFPARIIWRRWRRTP